MERAEEKKLPKAEAERLSLVRRAKKKPGKSAKKPRGGAATWREWVCEDADEMSDGGEE